jgi:menaquinone-dependent protoporphyrinogen oxidase
MTTDSVSRRQFLKVGCLTTAAAGAAVCGITAVLPVSDLPLVDLPSHSYGDDRMEKKILVAYASRAGSTAGVADAIGRTLADGGTRVDVRPMGEIADLEPYAAVVAGSAVHGGWLPEALEFVRAHRAALARRPFAAFLVCITLAMRGGENYREAVAKHLAPVRALVPPVSEGLFAGALDLAKLPAGESVRMRIPVALGIFPEGDRRDWEKIRAWSVDLRPRLAG